MLYCLAVHCYVSSLLSLSVSPQSAQNNENVWERLPWEKAKCWFFVGSLCGTYIIREIFEKCAVLSQDF